MVKFFKKHWEVLSYLIFGVLTTLLNIVLYALFNKLFGYTAANSWGNVLDNILCILFAYATNRAFVFRSRTQGREMAKEFGAFVTCRLGTLVLDAVIMMVGGNLSGKTNTLSLEIFNAVSRADFAAAAALCLILSIFTIVIFAILEGIRRRTPTE